MMALSDNEIKQLLEWFAKSSQTYREWSPKRKAAEDENHAWISSITSMTDEELENKFLEYYNSNTGYGTSFNKIFRDRITRNIDKFKTTIAHLFDENVDIENRIDDVLRRLYRIEGF